MHCVQLFRYFVGCGTSHADRSYSVHDDATISLKVIHTHACLTLAMIYLFSFTSATKSAIFFVLRASRILLSQKDTGRVIYLKSGTRALAHWDLFLPTVVRMVA